MLDVEQVYLAILVGVGFGIITALIGSSWQRLALFLLLLWTMQTGSQYVYRWLDGADVVQEVINVTVLRGAFALAACLVLAIANHYWHRRSEA